MENDVNQHKLMMVSVVRRIQVTDKASVKSTWQNARSRHSTLTPAVGVEGSSVGLERYTSVLRAERLRLIGTSKRAPVLEKRKAREVGV